MSGGDGCPRAREDGLVIEAIGDELLVYDTAVSRAHSLNASAAAVFQACDGTRSVGQIATECGLDEELAELALADLVRFGLVADHAGTAQGVSRRAVIRRLAVTGAALGVGVPAIRSITAPTAAMAAASTAPCTPGYTPPPGRHPKNPGGDCQNPGDCSPGSSCYSEIGWCVRGYGQSCYSQDLCADGSGGTNACPHSTGVCDSHCN
jgi:hypothetical protein